MYKKCHYYSVIPKLTLPTLNFYQNELRRQFAVGTVMTGTAQWKRSHLIMHRTIRLAGYILH